MAKINYKKQYNIFKKQIKYQKISNLDIVNQIT